MTDKLPSIIPVFPLKNVVFFAKTNLPLNIFEDRYIQLVKDCLKKERYFGMIQKKENESDKIYEIGCLGKIVTFSETDDGRFLINLLGINRFRISKEITNKKLYREFSVDYSKFSQDHIIHNNKKFKLDELIKDSKFFLKNKGYDIDWKNFMLMDQQLQIDNLIMILPFNNGEKQILLELISFEEKINMMQKMIKFYLLSTEENKNIQ